MCLRLLFLLVSHLFAWLRLSRLDESCKSAEILLVRHQLTILQRQVPARPKTTLAARALLAALVEVIGRRRRASLRLVITPETVLRWRRDILRRRWARRSQHKRPGRPATHHNIAALVLRLARENPGYVKLEVMWRRVMLPSSSRRVCRDVSRIADPSST